MCKKVVSKFSDSLDDVCAPVLFSSFLPYFLFLSLFPYMQLYYLMRININVPDSRMKIKRRRGKKRRDKRKRGRQRRGGRKRCTGEGRLGKKRKSKRRNNSISITTVTFSWPYS